MNLEQAEEFFYKDVVYRELEANKERNIFTNYNNFSRDHFVMEETFKECWKVMKHLQAEKELYLKQRDWAFKKETPPVMVQITKEENKKMMRYLMNIVREYEKIMKSNDVPYKHVGIEVSEKMEEV